MPKLSSTDVLRAQLGIPASAAVTDLQVLAVFDEQLASRRGRAAAAPRRPTAADVVVDPAVAEAAEDARIYALAGWGSPDAHVDVPSSDPEGDAIYALAWGPAPTRKVA